VPLQLCELAGQTAALAARLATDGNPNLRGDAITAALLARPQPAQPPAWCG